VPRRFRIVFRCFALALAALIASDSLDADCDPFPAHVQGAAMTAEGGAAPDACARTCVADCFCCSAVDGPAVDAATDPLGFLRMATTVTAAQAPSRTPAPPDQPPTLL
jgi:hypothetical protein